MLTTVHTPTTSVPGPSTATEPTDKDKDKPGGSASPKTTPADGVKPPKTKPDPPVVVKEEKPEMITVIIFADACWQNARVYVDGQAVATIKASSTEFEMKKKGAPSTIRLETTDKFKEDIKTLKVTKSDESKEYFDVKKLRVVFDRAAKGYEEECRFEDLMDSFKKNLVDDIRTSDIETLLVKTCIDLVTVENISWQNIAARILLGGLYKKATKNRGLAQKDIYSAAAFKAHFDHYIEKGLYYKDFYQYYSEEDILEAGKHLSKETDENYEYTTIVSFIKRYLLNPNKIIRELPQEMYLSIGLFLAIPEKKEKRLELALKIYEHCSKQRISLPTPPPSSPYTS